MQFNVAQLLKEPVGATRRYRVDERFPPLEHASVEWVRGSVLFTRTDRGVWVRGDLETSITCTCSRCLVEYTQPLPLHIDEEYFPTVDVNTGALLEVPGLEEGSFTIDAHHILDLTEAVRQYAIMAVPMKPLCRPDCRGICPHCGTNLNQGECGCRGEEGDPRWRALWELLSSPHHGAG